MIFNPYEGQLNPVKLILTLRRLVNRKGIELYSGFKVVDWQRKDNKLCLTFSNTDVQLHTQKLILATNAFTNDLVPGIDILPKRNQVLISQPLDLKLKGTYHFDKGYIYFRSIDNRLLIGGARNIDPTGESTADFGRNEKIISHLINFAQKNIDKNFKVEQQWSGIIAVGNTKTPLVKYVEKDILIAARMGGMGIAIGAYIAQIVSELI